MRAFGFCCIQRNHAASLSGVRLPYLDTNSANRRGHMSIPGPHEGKSTARLLPLVEKIPAFPQSVNRVLQLASDINCSTKDLVEVVSSDPVLTMRVLRLVNSAYFGLRNPVASIHQALVNLGVNTLKNIALSLAMLGALPRENGAGFDTEACWVHSLAVGLAARRLAGIAGVDRAEAEEFFVTGLLHDVGKLVLARHAPEEYRRALEAAAANASDLFETETSMLDATHAEVGAVLAGHWGLPETLGLALARHHAPDDGEPTLMADAVFAANQLTKRLGLGFSGNPVWQPFPAGVAKRLGMNADQALVSMADLPGELERAKAFLHL